MSVQLLYFNGCPSWRAAADNLTEALRRLGRTDSVDCHAIETPEEAEAMGFRGSPTVLIDGRDPFATPGAPAAVSSGLACRVYRTPDGLAGAPTIAQFMAALG